MDCSDCAQDVCYAAASVDNIINVLPEYQYYKDRLQSFKNWPYDFIVSKIDLARNGFFCKNSEDRVQCHYCRIILRKWSIFDSVFTEHSKYRPDCQYLRMTMK